MNPPTGITFNSPGWYLIHVSGWTPFPFSAVVKVRSGLRISASPWVNLYAGMLRMDDTPLIHKVTTGL